MDELRVTADQLASIRDKVLDSIVETLMKELDQAASDSEAQAAFDSFYAETESAVDYYGRLIKEASSK